MNSKSCIRTITDYGQFLPLRLANYGEISVFVSYLEFDPTKFLKEGPLLIISEPIFSCFLLSIKEVHVKVVKVKNIIKLSKYSLENWKYTVDIKKN